MTGSERPTASAARRRLRAVATPARAAATARYFKTGRGEYGEGDRFLGVTVPEQRTVAAAFRDLPLAESAKLLRSAWHEDRLLALLILIRQYRRGTPAQRDAIHRLYLDHLDRVNNWDLVDLSAGPIVGAHLPPGRRNLLRRLARSPVLWERRIAILATSHYIGAGEFQETLRLSRLLLHDPHDLIHKAVGWMLREVAKRDRAAALRFLDRHYRTMPRTMLRYAIERLPLSMRRRYLARPSDRR